ncbi:hypothetical protein BVX93_00260 [bacterium B13(2017)]|nr:hypothetical protein BVX93_00260 [bacterium B13(2017)]
MKKKLNITLLVDQGAYPDSLIPNNGYKNNQSTEHHIIQALNKLGHTINIVGVDYNVDTIVKEINFNRPDLVFNLTEQFRNNRMLDKNIAALLEMLDIPFTGTGPVGLTLCRNKALCKQILNSRKIQVPRFIVLPQNKKIRIPKSFKYPLIVKPLLEDGSEGISNASLVKNQKALEERAKLVHENWNEAAIAEEFIEGRELYVSILGNKRLTVFPPRELHFNNCEPGHPVMATYRVKWNPEFRKHWDIQFNYAHIEKNLEIKINRICKKVYRLLQIKDYGRIDIRITNNNQIYILEANPNPDLAYGDELALSAMKTGLSYEELINKIFHLTLSRFSSIS